MNDVVGGGEIDAGASRLERDEEHLALSVLEGLMATFIDSVLLEGTRYTSRGSSDLLYLKLTP
jgi:hypothetical protein